MKQNSHTLLLGCIMMFLVERICAFGSRSAPLISRAIRFQADPNNNNMRRISGCSVKASVQSDRETKTAKPKKQEQHQPPLVNLFTISKTDLQDIVVSMGYPKYRADQVYHWIREHGIVDLEKMANVPKKLRQDLAQFSGAQAEETEGKHKVTDMDHHQSTGGALEVVREQVSPKDGTIKRLYKLRDGLLIESVLMPYEDGRWTTCISSQAGCAQGCVFCATGQMGFQRQLTSDEIVEQVTRFSTYLKSTSSEATQSTKSSSSPDGRNKPKQHGKQQRLSNIVFMGEGEPLANFRNVMEAVPRIQELAGIGARKITISTVGVVPNIRKLMNSPIQVRLAVSLHCASDEERSALLPANRRYGGLDELMTTLHEYIETTGRRLTLEWALIEGENDTPEVARQLGNLLRKYKLRRDMVHVNVIPLNPTGGFAGSASGKKRVQEFVRILEEEFRVACTPRVRRGIDIDAGCGQLKAKELEWSEEQGHIETATVETATVDIASLNDYSFGSTTVDLDEDNDCANEDGEIMDETFDSSEAARLLSLIKGSVIKGA